MYIFSAIVVNVLTTLVISYLIAKCVFVYKTFGFSIWLLSAMGFGCASFSIGIGVWYVGVKEIKEADSNNE